MIYLDNASTTKIDDDVLEAMMPYLTESYGNAGTIYELGRRSASAISTARQQVAELIGASEEQILFTSGGTEANNLSLIGVRDFLLHEIGKKDIITSLTEHDSVLRAMEFLEGEGFNVSYISPSEDGSIHAEQIQKEIAEHEHGVGLVSVMHTNNETGAKNDIGGIGRLCQEHHILFHTDCVQAAGCSELNVDEMGCDLLSLSSHKIHGAKGAGALYVRNKDILNPIIFGGRSQEFGLRGGTENVAGIVGLGKACENVRNSLLRNSSRVGWLRQTLYNSIQLELEQRNLGEIFHLNASINFDEDDGKTMSVRFDGVDAETLVLLLDSRGVCVSSGSACRSHEQKPSRVLLSMGITPEDAMNSIRLSVSKMNTYEEIKEAAEITAKSVEEMLNML